MPEVFFCSFQPPEVFHDFFPYLIAILIKEIFPESFIVVKVFFHSSQLPRIFPVVSHSFTEISLTEIISKYFTMTEE
jgi:hypothetical protein